MVVYQRKNGKWYMNLMIRGKRYHRGIPEATCKKDAEKAEVIFKSELLQGRYNLADNKGEMLFSILADKYEEYASVNNLSWKSISSGLKKLRATFNNKKLNEITPILIEKYRIDRKKIKKKNGQEISNTTINREIEILRKMFNIAMDNEWIESNPCSGRKVKKLREEQGRERYLEPVEEKVLLSLCTNEHAYMEPIIVTALQTGMRKGEILNLKWACVDLEKKYITVTKTKTNRIRKIPISPKLMKYLKKLEVNKVSEHVFANPETKQPYHDLKRSFPSICKKAKIEGLRFHDLRHTAATRMVASGIDLVVVQEILGHSLITTTMRYSHPVPERKLAAVEALSRYGEDENSEESNLKVVK